MNAKPEVDDGKVTESRKAKVVVAAAMETASAAAVEIASPLDQQGRFCRFFFFFIFLFIRESSLRLHIRLWKEKELSKGFLSDLKLLMQ